MKYNFNGKANSKNTIFNTTNKFTEGHWQSMFLDDLCLDFSISFSKFSESTSFFTVKDDNKLREVLLFKDPLFLQYKFSELLSFALHDLLLSGSAYIEIVLHGSDTELEGISFQRFRYKRKIKKKNTTIFYGKDYLGSRAKFSILNDCLIKLDLRDLGLKRNHFKRILRYLGKDGLEDFDWLLSKNISYKEYNDKLHYKALTRIKKTYWDFRNPTYEYINDPYKLYRNIKFTLFRKSLLDYMLDQFNKKLRNLKLNEQITGEIAYSEIINCYEEELEDMLNGKRNCKQIWDLINEKYK